MEEISTFEAKTRFGAIIDKVNKTSTEITITRHGKPVAKIIPYNADADDPIINPSFKKFHEMVEKVNNTGSIHNRLRRTSELEEYLK